SNTAGADWTFNNSVGTGTGRGGRMVFKYADAGSTGSTQNTLNTAVGIGDTAGSGAASLWTASIKLDTVANFFTNSGGDTCTITPTSISFSKSFTIYAKAAADFSITGHFGPVFGAGEAQTGAFIMTNNGGTQTVLRGKASTAATLVLGAPDAASPVAQTLSVQNVVTGTSNTAGANFTIAGSQSTGNQA